MVFLYLAIFLREHYSPASQTVCAMAQKAPHPQGLYFHNLPKEELICICQAYTSIGRQDHAVSFFVAVCEKEKEEGEPHGIGVCSRKLKDKRALKFGALEH